MSTEVKNEQTAQNQEKQPSQDLSFELMPHEEVTLEKLADWKAKGDYEQIEYYIRSGDIELIPKNTMTTLVQMNQDCQMLLQNVKWLIQGIQPLLQEHEALSAYLDLTSPLKLNIGKLSEELMMLMSPFGKKDKGLVSILKNGVNIEALKQVDFVALKMLLVKNQIDLAPFLEFAKMLGIIPNQDNG